MKQVWLKQLISMIGTAAFFTAVFFVGRQAAVMTNGAAYEGRSENVRKQERQATEDFSKMQKFCVVLDAGHGGDDPGKVGINGALEKDLNLAIAKRLAVLLEQSDVRVVMTRTDENGLYDPGADRKKVQDMKRRLTIMEETEPDLVVSVHQNSYDGEAVRGAQVFYYTESTEGKLLAEEIQKCLIEGLDPLNHRSAKANSSYYLLKKTSRPIVIVECGFLSNSEEAKLLCDPVYQERTAWQIHMGILQYLRKKK